MALFTWSEKYHLNIRAIDEQHKHLFDIMNELHDIVTADRGHETVNHSVRELMKYIINHLQYEEQLLMDNNYDGLAAHKDEHMKFTSSILKYDIDLKLNGSIDVVELLAFTIDWLQDHILSTDIQYRDFLLARGVE